MYESSEYNITYLLGAGASAQALPIVRKGEGSAGMPEAFINMRQQIQSLSYDPMYSAYLEQLSNDLVWLSKGTNEFGTPDTYAKYLYLRSPSELNKLKNTLTAYFIFEQFLFNKFDKRALIFLTTIVQRRIIFPTNIKILNWNYDFQLQIAAEEFTEERFTPGSVSVHQPGLLYYFPGLGSNDYPAAEETSLIHLNGIAGSFYNSGFRRLHSLYERKEERNPDHFLSMLTNNVFNEGNLLSFAWEGNETTAKRRDYVKKIAENSDILVVIGYSFPFFNRQVDKEIFENLKSGGRLKKIYYQDPFRTGDFLKNQFTLPDSVEIKSLTEKDNYFIPMEL